MKRKIKNLKLEAGDLSIGLNKSVDVTSTTNENPILKYDTAPYDLNPNSQFVTFISETNVNSTKTLTVSGSAIVDEGTIDGGINAFNQ